MLLLVYERKIMKFKDIDCLWYDKKFNLILSMLYFLEKFNYSKLNAVPNNLRKMALHLTPCTMGKTPTPISSSHKLSYKNTVSVTLPLNSKNDLGECLKVNLS